MPELASTRTSCEPTSTLVDDPAAEVLEADPAERALGDPLGSGVGIGEGVLLVAVSPR